MILYVRDQTSVYELDVSSNSLDRVITVNSYESYGHLYELQKNIVGRINSHNLVGFFGIVL